MAITLFLSAQTPPDTLWTRTFGGIGDDYAQSSKKTSDGGYIIAGYTDSYGAGLLDFWLIKTDENGTEEWDQTFGGSQNDYAKSVQHTSDGGYIIAGYTESYGAGACDVWLIKTNSSGTEEWTQTFGSSSNDRAFSVQQTSDGGYIIAGAKTTAGDSDIWLIKTDSSGIEEWNHTFSEAVFEEAFSVQQTLDGGYVIAGYSGPFSNLDAWVIKTNSLGIEEWSHTYGGNNAEIAESIEQTSDGGYIFAGLTESYGAGLFDIWTVKTDSDGNEEWNQTFGGVGNDIAYTVHQTPEGGYIIAGCTGSFGANGNNFWLIKLKNTGTNENAGVRFDLDATTYGNQNLTTISNPGVGAYLRVDCYAINVHNLDTYEFEIHFNSGKFQYITSSATNPLTYEGNILTKNGGTAVGWMVDTSIPGVLSIAYTLTGTDTLEAPEGDGLIADVVFQLLSEVEDTLSFGNVYFYDTYGEVNLITDKDVAVIQGSVSVDDNESEIRFEDSKLDNYPNPVMNSTRITYAIKGMRRSENVEIDIYNVIGQIVDSVEGRNGESIWNPKDHPNGVYFYKIHAGEEAIIKKMVVMK